MWLLDENGKVYHTTEKVLSTDLGIVKLRGAKVGTVLKSHLGRKFLVVEPNHLDFIKRMRRGPQIIHPKDVGVIVTYLGIGSGDKVADIGAGSGGVTFYLSRIVGREGKVYAYERDGRFVKVLEENKKLLNAKNVLIRQEDGRNIRERDLDGAVVDVKEPKRVLEPVRRALKPGASLAVYLPNITQVKELLEGLEGWIKVSVFEILKRDWVVKEKVLRPEHRLLGHTGFITILRKFP